MKASRFKELLLLALGFLGRALLLLLVVGGVFYAVDTAWDSPRALKYFQLQEIHFEGATHVSEKGLRTLIQKTSPRNLLQIDLERVRNIVESEAWVKSATVRRKLPGELYVYLAERKPVAVAAIERELYVVDEDGTILDQHRSDYLLDGPVVKGLRHLTPDDALTHNGSRMQVYASLIFDLASGEQDHSAAVSEVDVENPRRVGIVLEGDPVPIYLGEDSFLERFQRFLSRRDVYAELKEEYGLIEYIDLSYDNKIIFHTPDERREHVMGGSLDHPL